ncbi:thioredoxin-like domain-containing protein [Flaviaesturariibacter amylovorans]|uniref:Thioredoxin domain-containing protein n=1 Tax=Flaviaesturariibacter amylovorans TaxID=1084520 RepID=A0ABP8HUM0_9BACT
MMRIAPFLALLLSTAAVAQKKPVATPTPKPVEKRAASTGAAGAGGYEIQVTLKPFRNQWIYLGHYFGKQLPIIDSVKLNDQSTGTFRGSKPLGGGIYLVGFPDRARHFEILIDKQQKFAIQADTATLPRGLSFTGSDDNTQFHAYQNAMAAAGRTADSLGRLRSANPADSARLTAEINAVTERVQQYRSTVMTETPNSLLATLLKAMKEPESPIKNPKTREDSLAAYRYYKDHYFDGINFYDERLSRTPFFEARVDRYIDQLLYPAADSVIKELDYILSFASINKEMQKFFLLKFVNRYLNMKYMWEDRVFVHLYQKYFADKHYEWLTDKGKKIIQDRAYSLMMNITGEPAADIDLPDSTGKAQRLYNVKAPYTLLVIWDPTCGHCKETLPKLDTMYQQKWRKNGVKIFALAKETEGTRKDWTSFISKFKLNDWVHVYYSKEAEKARLDNNIPSYSQLFDVQSFPTMLLLDKDKKIIAKKLAEKQIDEILAEFEKKNKTSASK